MIIKPLTFIHHKVYRQNYLLIITLSLLFITLHYSWVLFNDK